MIHPYSTSAPSYVDRRCTAVSSSSDTTRACTVACFRPSLRRARDTEDRFRPRKRSRCDPFIRSNVRCALLRSCCDEVVIVLRHIGCSHHTDPPSAFGKGRICFDPSSSPNGSGVSCVGARRCPAPCLGSRLIAGPFRVLPNPPTTFGCAHDIVWGKAPGFHTHTHKPTHSPRSARQTSESCALPWPEPSPATRPASPQTGAR